MTTPIETPAQKYRRWTSDAPPADKTPSTPSPEDLEAARRVEQHREHQRHDAMCRAKLREQGERLRKLADTLEDPEALRRLLCVVMAVLELHEHSSEVRP